MCSVTKRRKVTIKPDPICLYFSGDVECMMMPTLPSNGEMDSESRLEDSSSQLGASLTTQGPLSSSEMFLIITNGDGATRRSLIEDKYSVKLSESKTDTQRKEWSQPKHRE